MQLAFDFPSEPFFLEEAKLILSSSNIEAYHAIYNANSWPDNRLLLIGAPSSGKSQLAKIFTDRTGGNFYYPNLYLDEIDTTALVIEDIDEFHDEELLFHIMNHCQRESIQMLLTATTIPKFGLKDLISRINSMNKILIKQPDISILKRIIEQKFQLRQLRVHEEVVDYILLNLERSYGAVNHIVETLDKLSLTQKRNITIPLVRSIIVECKHQK